MFTTLVDGKPCIVTLKLKTVDVTFPDESFVWIMSMVAVPAADASALLIAGDSFDALRSAVKRVDVVPDVVVEGDALFEDEQPDARRMPRATIESRFMFYVTPSVRLEELAGEVEAHLQIVCLSAARGLRERRQ
jgi:hypothetical protein